VRSLDLVGARSHDEREAETDPLTADHVVLRIHGRLAARANYRSPTPPTTSGAVLRMGVEKGRHARKRIPQLAD
jgi:hypothetical protein